MDFYYCPILGLQFTCGLSFCEIDLDLIPQNYNWEDMLFFLRQKGVMFVNSIIEKPVNVFNSITSNSIL